MMEEILFVKFQREVKTLLWAWVIFWMNNLKRNTLPIQEKWRFGIFNCFCLFDINLLDELSINSIRNPSSSVQLLLVPPFHIHDHVVYIIYVCVYLCTSVYMCLCVYESTTFWVHLALRICIGFCCGKPWCCLYFDVNSASPGGIAWDK